jgi:hypothetical protein
MVKFANLLNIPSYSSTVVKASSLSQTGGSKPPGMYVWMVSDLHLTSFLLALQIRRERKPEVLRGLLACDRYKSEFLVLSIYLQSLVPPFIENFMRNFIDFVPSVLAATPAKQNKCIPYQSLCPFSSPPPPLPPHICSLLNSYTDHIQSTSLPMLSLTASRLSLLGSNQMVSHPPLLISISNFLLITLGTP